MNRRKPAPEQQDSLVTISEDERKEWRRLRDEKKLTTRQLGKLVGVSHSLVSHIEGGTQRQAKRSVYAAFVSALYGVTEKKADALADEAVAREDAAFKRLVKALAGLPAEQIEALAMGVEAGKPRGPSK